MDKEYRIITEREVFDALFLTTWRTCMDIAVKELIERTASLNKEFTIADMLSATAQLSITWNQNLGRIENEKIKRQAIIDKKFNQPIKKDV